MKIVRKCSDKIMAWWRQVIAPSQPTQEELNRMLSGSFSCFVITLFLFVFFIVNPQNDGVFLYTSIASFLFAVFLLVAVFLVNRCPGFYACAKKFNDRIAVTWIFMLTAVVAFSRLLEVLKMALQTEQMLIRIAFVAFVLYFVAYLVATWSTNTTGRRQQRPDSVLQFHSMTLSGLVYIMLLMLLNNICPGAVLTATWSFVAVLIIDVIPLSMVFGKERSEQRVHIRTSLAIMVVVVLLLIVGEALGIFSLWYWFCLVLLLSAAILLWITVKAEYMALEHHAV